MSFVTRVLRTRDRMDELGVDVLLLSVGADLPYLTGYDALVTRIEDLAPMWQPCVEQKPQ